MVHFPEALHQTSLNLLAKHFKLLKEDLLATSSATVSVSRSEFESSCRSLTLRAGDVLRRALRSFKTAVSPPSKHSQDGDGDEEEIQELVMVGGGSLMPCVQAEVLAVLQAEKMTPFLPPDQGGEGRSLCTAVDPHFAVAEGLAIRAAVLMGFDVGSMQDVLMLDILPHSIGVLSWMKRQGEEHRISSTSIDNQSEYVRVFDPIIHRGERIPATCCRRFPFESAASGKRSTLVSLDIYEDRGLTALNTCNASTSIHGGVNEGVRNEEIGTRYHLMGTYDAPIESTGIDAILRGLDPDTPIREVEVEFTLSIHGGLSFKVRPSILSTEDVPLDQVGQATGADKETTKRNVKTSAVTTGAEKSGSEVEDPMQMILLAVCAAILLVLYGFVKSYLIN